MKLIYTGIRVKDMDRAIEFYTSGLGMKLIQKPQRFAPTGGLFAYIKNTDSPQVIELNWYPETYSKGYHDGDQLDHLGFWLKKDDNMDKILERLVKLGAKVTMSPYVEGRTKLAFVKDTDGIWIEFLQRVGKKKIQ